MLHYHPATNLVTKPIKLEVHQQHKLFVVNYVYFSFGRSILLSFILFYILVLNLLRIQKIMKYQTFSFINKILSQV